MKIRCVWEHHGNDTLLYSDNFVGAFTRGASREEAMEKMPSEIMSYLMEKMPSEIMSYLRWKKAEIPAALETELVQEKESDLEISGSAGNRAGTGKRVGSGDFGCGFRRPF